MKVIIGGASNTNGPWPTWSEIVQHRYHADWIDVSRKGLGNEAIILRSLRTAWEHKQDNILIMIMLTSVDKWDWYVDQPALLEKFAKEKHTITYLSDKDPGGFWGTGSWFPLDKTYYQEHYYSQDYFTLRSLQMISMFIDICNKQKWKYHVMYDGPIWSMTEQELNQGGIIQLSNKLIDTPLCRWAYDSAKIQDIGYGPGLIGFLDQNQLPWFSNTYGPHPGPSSHLAFAKDHIFPALNPLLNRYKDDRFIEQMISKMDNLWTA